MDNEIRNYMYQNNCGDGYDNNHTNNEDEEVLNA